MEMAPENSKEEELKKLEEDNAKLAEVVHSLTAAKKQTEDELAANTAELETLKQASAQDQEETKKQQAELQTKKEELSALQGQHESAKNVQAKLKIYVTSLEKRLDGDDETHKLLEDCMERISTLETEKERLKAENEELQKTSTLKEEQATTVLKTARAKLQKSEDEKKKLELELEQIGE